MLGTFLKSKIADGSLAGLSAFQAQEVVHNMDGINGGGSDGISDIIIPFIIGIVVPFLKDALLGWQEKRREKRLSKQKAK